MHVERNFSLARRYPPTNKANSPNLLAPVDSMLGRAGALLVGHAASTVLSRLNWTGCLPTQRELCEAFFFSDDVMTLLFLVRHNRRWLQAPKNEGPSPTYETPEVLTLPADRKSAS